jgi:hypothetical protein
MKRNKQPYNFRLEHPVYNNSFRGYYKYEVKES